jgi:hypothetical protein
MTEEEILWVMPKPDVGCTIKVFPNGRNDSNPHHAFVCRVHDRSIDVQSPLGTARGGVRFLGDPVLKTASDENLRTWGAWDYTDETKAAKALTTTVKTYQEEFAALKADVELLKELMTDKPTKPAKSKE